MNEVMISVDILPIISAMCGREAAAQVAGRFPSATSQPSADAVAAFQAAMGSLVAENREVQAVLEQAVPLPLEAPVVAPEAKPVERMPVAEAATARDGIVAEAKPAEVARAVAPEAKPVEVAPAVMPEARPAVAQAVAPQARPVVTPEIVREFAEVIAPLVAENREVQAVLEQVVPLPLEVPVVAPEAKPTPVAEAATARDGIVAEAKPVDVARAVAPEAKPAVTPEIVREFAEVIAPLVAENREVQAALEQAVPLPLEVPAVAPEAKPTDVAQAVAPEAKPAEVAQAVAPEAKPAVTPEIVREFAEVIAPLVAENREVQAVLEQVVPLPLEVPAVTPEIVREFAEVIAPLVAENREVQAVLEQAVPLPLEVQAVAPEAKQTERTPVAEAATARDGIVPEAKPVDAPQAKPVVVPEVKRVVKSAVAGKEQVRGVEQPDAGMVMQASPVVPPPQVDSSVRVAASSVAVDGVAAAVASQRTAPTPSEVLIAAAEAVADTIMVTPGLLTGEGQIRVQLRPDVLDGTEIQLDVTGKAITVEFLPQTADMGVLIQRCLPQLEQHLAARIHSFTIAATVGTVRRRKS